ncbi:MAG: hypothetical protein M0P31_12700 [Solirubrobacteraceae bacterium]|nr:hypothetical protein [Solirubrobacteraceae bacterium]
MTNTDPQTPTPTADEPADAPAAITLRERPLALAADVHQRALGMRLRREDGQGTVEYVALAMLVAAVMAGVVLFMRKSNGGGIGEAVLGKIKEAIGHAGKAPK